MNIDFFLRMFVLIKNTAFDYFIKSLESFPAPKVFE